MGDKRLSISWIYPKGLVVVLASWSAFSYRGIIKISLLKHEAIGRIEYVHEL